MFRRDDAAFARARSYVRLKRKNGKNWVSEDEDTRNFRFDSVHIPGIPSTTCLAVSSLLQESVRY